MRATVVTGMPLRIVMSLGTSVRETCTRSGPLGVAPLRRDHVDEVGPQLAQVPQRGRSTDGSSAGAVAGRIDAGEP